MSGINGKKVLISKPLRLGEAIALAFEHALRITRDPKRAAAVAALMVARALQRGGRMRLLRRLATV